MAVAPKPSRHGEVVRVAGAGGFDDDVGIATQALFDQTWSGLAPTAIGCRNRQAIFSDIPVGDAPAALVPLRTICSALSHSCFDGRFERGFRDVEGDIQSCLRGSAPLSWW